MNTPPLCATDGAVRFYFFPDDLRLVRALPWTDALERWHLTGVRMLPVKSGLSRHVVRFVEAGERRFAVKETTLDSARREFAAYVRMRLVDVPTLVPVGIVARDEGSRIVHTAVGRQQEQLVTGYLVTELMEKVVPDSFLFRRAFSRQNRLRIWDAVIRLFIELHGRGIYWGDASLANMLIHFSTERVPELGRRTTLRAVLADAETVEIHSGISRSLRAADLDFFLESMQWTAADMAAGGEGRDPLMTRDDMDYIRARYDEGYAVELEMRSFELVTRIDADRLLGNFDTRGYGRLLLQHINEHKWYLSERKGGEVTIEAAADDWYRTIFKPVCGIFQEYGLLSFFPQKTASSLYVEIMEHKYYMSERERRDVGLVAAVEDYCALFSKQEPFRVTLEGIVQALRNLFLGLPGGRGDVYLS